MNTPKHTPGEWRCEPCVAGGGLVLRGGWNGTQQRLQIVPIQDAYLFAASKAMYEALKAILQDYDTRGKMYPGTEAQPNRVKVMEAGRAALEKATPSC